MKRIKTYKLFLEGIKDDDDFKRKLENLKLSLYAMLEPIFSMEKNIRMTGDVENLSEGADSLIELLFNMFVQSVNSNPDLSEEFKDLVLEKFDKSLKNSKSIFIEKSFKEGLDKSLDFFVEFLEAIKKSAESEGEEWKQAKEKDYEDMSKSEINALIDQALDDRDFDKVKFLSQYMKESFEITDDMKADIQKFCDELVDFIVKNYQVL